MEKMSSCPPPYKLHFHTNIHRLRTNLLASSKVQQDDHKIKDLSIVDNEIKDIENSDRKSVEHSKRKDQDEKTVELLLSKINNTSNMCREVITFGKYWINVSKHETITEHIEEQLNRSKNMESKSQNSILNIWMNLLGSMNHIQKQSNQFIQFCEQSMNHLEDTLIHTNRTRKQTEKTLKTVQQSISKEEALLDNIQLKLKDCSKSDNSRKNRILKGNSNGKEQSEMPSSKQQRLIGWYNEKTASLRMLKANYATIHLPSILGILRELDRDLVQMLQQQLLIIFQALGNLGGLIQNICGNENNIHSESMIDKISLMYQQDQQHFDLLMNEIIERSVNK